MKDTDSLPPDVRHSFAYRFNSAREARRRKLEFIRAYGRDRGIVELMALGEEHHRVPLANALKEARELLLSNGYRPSRVRAELMSR